MPFNNKSAPAAQVDITPGSALDSTRSQVITSLRAISVRGDRLWAEDAPGMDVSTLLQAGASYHLHAIYRATDGAVSGLMSGSALNPILPLGWTHFRRLHGLCTDASGYILTGRYVNDWFSYDVPQVPFYRDYLGVITPITGFSMQYASLIDMVVPKGVKVISRALHISYHDTGVQGWLFTKDPDTGGTQTMVNDPLYGKLFRFPDVTHQGVLPGIEMEDWTDAMGRLQFMDSAGLGARLTLKQRGWRDLRAE